MGTTAARTSGAAATLAVGAVTSVCLMAAPAASAADTTGTDTDTPAVAANVGGGLRDALDRARGLFTFNDGDVAGAVADAQNAAQKLREQAQNALRDADVAKKLNLANDNVVALTDFVNELNAHAGTLNSVLVSMPDAPKDADTLDTVTLTMTTRDGQVGVKTLNNVPRDAAETLRTALEGAVDSVKVDTATTTTKSPTPTPTTPKVESTTSAPKVIISSKPEAPAATTTQRDGDNTGTDADLNASIDELRRIAAAIEAAKANNPQAIEEMLARLADPSRGAGHADINTVTGKNVNTVQNVSANTGSTSVAINIDPDGGLSISAAQGTDGAGGTAQPEKDTAKDADAVIAALDNLAAALRGEDAAPKGDGAGTGTDTDNTDTAAPTSTMTEDEAAQHDRLWRALLALTSPEREANSPASRERDALIMIAQALKDGKDINLEELTTEQMLQVMDWLQNGIPEMTKPDATATAEPTATSTATEPTATESSTVTTAPTQSSSSPSQTGVVTVTETASPTTTTTTKKKKDKDSDETEETEEASKELVSAINGLAKGLADRHSTAATTTTSSTDRDDTRRDGTNAAEVQKVNTTSTTRVPAKKQGNTGGGSGSGSGSSSNGSGSNSGSASNSNGNTAQSNTTGGGSAATATATATAAPAAENTDADTMQAEAVSEELAVTGNSTQRMLMLLTLLGGVAAAALFVAMRRTRAE